MGSTLIGKIFAPIGANYFNLSQHSFTLLHSERPKLYAILAFLSVIGLRMKANQKMVELLPLKIYQLPQVQ